jgi:hypothetical protein
MNAPRKPLRAAVWSTGWVGRLAIQTIAARRDLDLVGVWVHAPGKVGRDAGILSGGIPLGLTATNDIDALLTLKPDCVCYAANGPANRDGAIEDYVRMLEAGINVVLVTTWGLIHPPSFPEPTRSRLEQAARRGGATIYASGLEPGFAADHLALTLTLMTMSRSVRSVRTQEIFLTAIR